MPAAAVPTAAEPEVPEEARPTPLLQRLRLPKGLRFVLVAPSLLAGCAGPNQVARGAARVSFAGLDAGQGVEALTSLETRPVVVHFAKGQRVPIDLAIESKLFEVELPPTELVASRDFYLLLRADGPPLLSEDGVEFERRPENAFMLGFEMKKQQPTRVRLGLSVRSR